MVQGAGFVHVLLHALGILVAFTQVQVGFQVAGLDCVLKVLDGSADMITLNHFTEVRISKVEHSEVIENTGEVYFFAFR